jgi:transposase
MSSWTRPGSPPSSYGYSTAARARAEAHLYAWLTHCADAGVRERQRLARTLDSWLGELLAYFDTDRISNGPTKAINLLIKNIKRVGHGFRNSTTTGSASCCTAASNGTLPTPSPTRGRLPRFVA